MSNPHGPILGNFVIGSYFHQAHFLQKFYSTLHWVQEKYLYHKNQEITRDSTLSYLFNTYCMNIHGSPLWKYYDKKLLELFCVAWRKSLRRVWDISK